MTSDLPAFPCQWCGAPFAASFRGGPPRRFCSGGCQRAYNAALRAWARELVEEGFVTPASLRAWVQRRIDSRMAALVARHAERGPTPAGEAAAATGDPDYA